MSRAALRASGRATQAEVAAWGHAWKIGEPDGPLNAGLLHEAGGALLLPHLPHGPIGNIKNGDCRQEEPRQAHGRWQRAGKQYAKQQRQAAASDKAKHDLQGIWQLAHGRFLASRAMCPLVRASLRAVDYESLARIGERRRLSQIAPNHP